MVLQTRLCDFLHSILLHQYRMKKSIISLALSAMFLGAMLSGCNSPQEKVENAKDDLHDAQKYLAQYKQDSIEDAEWKEFKVSAQAKIDANRSDIAALREKKSKGGVFMDPIYGKQILTLEEKTLALQIRIDDYEKYHSNWETFKREFDHDAEELGNTLKNISTDNSK
jgi:PBP1b-binding outer membrane lipoprotein LpoB